MVYGVKEITVEMGNIIKEMGNHMPEGFFWHHVFLATVLAIMALHNGAAIKAVLFFAFWNVRHGKFFLKNKYKKIQEAFLFRYCEATGAPAVKETIKSCL